MLLRKSCEDVDGRRGSDAGGGSGGNEPEGPKCCDPLEGARYGCDEDENRDDDAEGIGASLRLAASSGMRSVLLLTRSLNADEGDALLSVRDFFQICSVGEGRSSVSLRFFGGTAGEAGTGRAGGRCGGGGGVGGGSSSSERVRSMTSGT